MDLDALEHAARDRLDPAVYDYFAGGADDELTVADNLAAWRRWRLRPRVLRDVSEVSLATTVLGAEVAMPVLLAPTGYQRLAHDEGERATARAARGAGTVMVASTFATVALEDIADAAPGGHRWFQLYVLRDRGFTADLVRRAAAAGYEAIVPTVDLPVLGRRRRDDTNQLTLPDGMEMENLRRAVPTVPGSGIAAFADDEIDPSLTFADVEWLAGLTDLPVVPKGIVRGDDTTVATADALAEVVAAVAGRAEVYVDGGIRAGTSVLKALALGAQAVLIGRPFLWGLATGGSDGVHAVLDHFRDETRRAFALCGVRGVAEATPDLLARPGHPGPNAPSSSASEIAPRR